MALCEHCRAEIAGETERLPAPWFDHDTRQIAGQPTTAKVWQVLEILWRRRDRMVTTDTLMTLLYEDEPENPPDDDIIKVYVCRLRQHLDPTPYAISTHWSDGYQLVDRERVAVRSVSLGDPETGVTAPERHGPNHGADKYRFAELEPGQSRVVEGASLATLKQACRKASKRGVGKFECGYDAAAKLRIWRVT